MIEINISHPVIFRKISEIADEIASREALYIEFSEEKLREIFAERYSCRWSGPPGQRDGNQLQFDSPEEVTAFFLRIV